MKGNGTPPSSGLEPKAPQEPQLCWSQAVWGGSRLSDPQPQGRAAGRALPEQRARTWVLAPNRRLCPRRGSAAPVPPRRPHAHAPCLPHGAGHWPRLGRRGSCLRWGGREKGRKGGILPCAPRRHSRWGPSRWGNRGDERARARRQPRPWEQGWSRPKAADGASALALCRNLWRGHLLSPGHLRAGARGGSWGKSSGIYPSHPAIPLTKIAVTASPEGTVLPRDAKASLAL